MAGFIRYKLPTDKPRRRKTQRRVDGQERWSPPPLLSDARAGIPMMPRRSVSFATGAGALAAVGALVVTLPVAAVFGGSLSLAPIVFLVAFVAARRLPRRSSALARDVDRGFIRSHGALLGTSWALFAIGSVFAGLSTMGNPAHDQGLAFGAMFAGAGAVAAILSVRAWFRYRSLRSIATEPDVDLLLDCEASAACGRVH